MNSLLLGVSVRYYLQLYFSEDEKEEDKISSASELSGNEADEPDRKPKRKRKHKHYKENEEEAAAMEKEREKFKKKKEIARAKLNKQQQGEPVSDLESLDSDLDEKMDVENMMKKDGNESVSIFSIF